MAEPLRTEWPDNRLASGVARDAYSLGSSLRDPFTWRFDDDDDEDEDETERIRQLVNWDIVLSASHLDGPLHELKDNERWVTALPTLLTDFTGLLRDALDLMSDLGGADEKRDLSYSSQPSISEHTQNHSFRDWTILVDLNRDAWLATAGESRERARLVADTWSRIPYPLFRRLAFFAAAQDDFVPHGDGLKWLLMDEKWWLWSIETQRETMRLLVALAPRLDEDELVRLEHAILAGPPREMYSADIEEERWIRIQDRDIWLCLAKISQAGAELNAAARERLNGLSTKYPDWQLAEDEREEFPAWMSDDSELCIHVKTPRDRDELIEWLRENPDPDVWRPDDWCERCRDDFDEASSALTTLAEERIWPTGRWREALQPWSEDELTERSWHVMAPVLANVPGEALQELSHAVSRWLEKLARTFNGQEELFLSFCDRILALDFDVGEEDGDPVARAINHPVGHVTDALLHWWYRNDLQDELGLAYAPRRIFTQLCDTETPKFRHGRVLLAAHVISLFRVDREWAIQFLLPLFKWENSEVEARSAWEGFLRSPRLYYPLLEVLKPAFLDTANHYTQLGRHSKQYASLLTFVGLDPGDVFQNPELALATRVLPREALEHAAETFFRAVDSAGDQRADYWRNRAAPYLKAIWPKTTDANSKTVSKNFALACIAADDAFPEALKLVRSWLRPLRYPSQFACALHKAELDTRYPEPTLELLHRVVADEVQGPCPDLSSCLDAIRVKQPELEHDPRFQRLLKIVQEMMLR